MPYSIIAVLCFAASVLCCLLPETRNAPTLEVMSAVNSDNSEAGKDEEELTEEGDVRKNRAKDTNTKL